MKNIKEYNLRNLCILACSIGVTIAVLEALIEEVINISVFNYYSGGFVTGGTIVIVIILLHKTGKDKFLLKNKKNDS